MGRAVSVDLAKRLKWEAEGLVDVKVTRRSVRHPWSHVQTLELTRGRWDVMDLDITSPWFDAVPLHVVVEVDNGRIRRRLDREHLVRFGRTVTGIDPAASSRSVTRAFLEELMPVLGWASLPGAASAADVGADGPWDPPDPDLW